MTNILTKILNLIVSTEIKVSMPRMTSEQLHNIINQICPECEGVNLTEDKTKCFDCDSANYE